MTKLFGWKEVTTDWFSIIIGWTPGNCEGNKPVSEKWFEGIEAHSLDYDFLEQVEVGLQPWGDHIVLTQDCDCYYLHQPSLFI